MIGLWFSPTHVYFSIVLESIILTNYTLTFHDREFELVQYLLSSYMKNIIASLISFAKYFNYGIAVISIEMIDASTRDLVSHSRRDVTRSDI